MAVVLALTAPACASTGAVPRPFPGAASKGPGLPADDPASEAAGRPSPDRITGPLDTYALVGTALSLRGTPYRNGGGDPGGFDCSGFTQYVFARYGIALPRATRDQFQVGQDVDARELAPGDLIFFTTT